MNRDTPVQQHSTDTLAVPPVDDITDFDFEPGTFTHASSMSSLHSYNTQASYGSSRPSTPSETFTETDVSNFKPEYPNAPLVHTTSLKSVHGMGPHTSETTVDTATQSEDKSGYESGSTNDEILNLVRNYRVNQNGAETSAYRAFKKRVEKGGELFDLDGQLIINLKEFKALIKSLPLYVVRALSVAPSSTPETLQKGHAGDIARYAFYEMVIHHLHNGHPNIDLSDEIKKVKYFNTIELKELALENYKKIKKREL